MKLQSVNLQKLFENLDTGSFHETFDTEEKCLSVLAEYKWKDGFQCQKCGSNRYGKGKKPYSRRCTRCKTEESVTAHTIFHHCRLELPKAFEIAYLVCGRPGIPASQISEILDTRHMTCLNFKKKILECISTRETLELQPVTFPLPEQ